MGSIFSHVPTSELLMTVSRVSKAWALAVERFLDNNAHHLIISGPLRMALDSRLQNVRRISFCATEANVPSLPRQGPTALSLTRLEVTHATRKNFANETLQIIANAAPVLKWLEMDFIRPREALHRAYGSHPEFMRNLDVIIAGMYGDYVMFRGFRDRQAVERVLLRQEQNAKQKGANVQILCSFYRGILGDPNWTKILPHIPHEEHLVETLSQMMRSESDGGECSNLPSFGQTTFLWHNVHDFNMVGRLGVCYFCAMNHHNNKSVVLQYVSSNAYCDCPCSNEEVDSFDD